MRSCQIRIWDPGGGGEWKNATSRKKLKQVWLKKPDKSIIPPSVPTTPEKKNIERKKKNFTGSFLQLSA